MVGGPPCICVSSCQLPLPPGRIVDLLHGTRCILWRKILGEINNRCVPNIHFPIWKRSNTSLIVLILRFVCLKSSPLFFWCLKFHSVYLWQCQGWNKNYSQLFPEHPKPNLTPGQRGNRRCSIIRMPSFGIKQRWQRAPWRIGAFLVIFGNLGANSLDLFRVIFHQNQLLVNQPFFYRFGGFFVQTNKSKEKSPPVCVPPNFETLMYPFWSSTKTTEKLCLT